MSKDSKPKKMSIPEWQKADHEPPAKHASSIANEAPPLEQAIDLLEDESIRHESRERKVEYLEKKSLPNNEIQKLLGPEDNTASAAEEEAELKTVHDSNTSTTQNSIGPEPTPTNPGPSASRDIPPVITYPEFLLRPQRLPPLVTWQRLAYAAYGFAGLSALTYATSTYLVQPMLENLTAARHELAETAIQDLQKLNSKIELNVSHVPYIPDHSTSNKTAHPEHIDDDDESTVSDPTELFHRDIATQTSPILLPNTHPFDDPSTAQTHQDTPTMQSTRLRTLHSTLSSLAASTDDTTSSTSTLQTTLEDFQTFLNTVQFSGASSHRPDFSNLYSTLPEGSKSSKSTHDTDEAAKLKAEIRALKGVFLSSRNFPSGRAVGAR